uniref:Cytochrome c assembly protein domain-containing protein n=1 Tax=Manihot esculenta TaxID=3983 RepID=A0A2C9VJL9_MANES
MHQSEILVPTLQSMWLMMHISMMILGYAALLCRSLFSVAFLVITFRKIIRIFYKSNNLLNNSFFFSEIQYMAERKNVLRNISFLSSRNYYRFQLIQQLDDWVIVL